MKPTVVGDFQAITRVHSIVSKASHASDISPRCYALPLLRPSIDTQLGFSEVAITTRKEKG